MQVPTGARWRYGGGRTAPCGPERGRSLAWRKRCGCRPTSPG